MTSAISAGTEPSTQAAIRAARFEPRPEIITPTLSRLIPSAFPRPAPGACALCRWHPGENCCMTRSPALALVFPARPADRGKETAPARADGGEHIGSEAVWNGLAAGIGESREKIRMAPGRHAADRPRRRVAGGAGAGPGRRRSLFRLG